MGAIECVYIEIRNHAFKISLPRSQISREYGQKQIKSEQNKITMKIVEVIYLYQIGVERTKKSHRRLVVEI